MKLKSKHHLSYCSNIHPGPDWESTFNSLQSHLPEIKKQFSPSKDFGLGLRLSNKASEELGLGENLTKFRDWLANSGCYVFTMNGFPYGNFHGERVKDQVHAPDWTTKERLDYTTRIFEQLAILLPEGMEGGISTSPISYKHWHSTDVAKKSAFEIGALQMSKVAVKLHQIEKETGKYLHLDVEPEPDGLLENTAEVLHFFKEYLVPIAQNEFSKGGITNGDELVKRYITVCYDVCHFSLAYEEPENTFTQFLNDGIRVGKIQISAALKILWYTESPEQLWNALESFNEPVYLHQVTEKKGSKVKTYADLPEILTQKKEFKELRAHFHVPIFLKGFGLLQSTQDQIVKTLDYLKEQPDLTNHLEVETYTWEVLPKDLKMPLTDSVVRELEWVKEHLS